GESVHIEFDSRERGEWIRVRTDKNTKGTVHFSYTDLSRFQETMDPLFEGLAMMGEGPSTGGLLYGLGNNRRALGILAGGIENNSFLETGYYELDGEMNLVKKKDPETADFIRTKFAIPKEVVSVEPS